MCVRIGGDKQPAVGLVLTHTAHPVADSERLAVFLDPLQIANGFDIVGQYGTNGDSRFLNLFLHQVSGRRVFQVRAQFVDFDGQHGINQLFVATVFILAHQVRTFGKYGAAGALPERVLFSAHRNQRIRDVIKIR
ncbi:Uncharacterised protein [Klebsiella oxytoca]|nr:Uncharacterised protein [Klebsiella oxytoca]